MAPCRVRRESFRLRPRDMNALGFAVRSVALVVLVPGIGRSVDAAEGPAPNPPFSIEKQDQIFWAVRPDGARFFSLGVCCVNQGASRDEFEPANPGYAGWQHYADSNLWATATLRRLAG